MTDHPKIDNAPGLTWNRRKHGRWEARWQARTDLVARGYLPKSARIWAGKPEELNEVAIQFIQDRCNLLQDDMLVFGRGGVPVVTTFSGTLGGLIACYQSDPDSPYHKKRYKTRRHYDILCRRLDKDHGEELIAEIKARHLLRWHEKWGEGGKVAMPHSLIGMLRTLTGFGATILEDDECARLSAVLSKMRFAMAKPRSVHLTADQANAIRAKAHELGKHSIALAQAFQFEGMLRQKDVIGEWVPHTEPGVSDVTVGNEKWLRGLRWSEIDEHLILRHVTSKRLKEIEIDLKNAPMVMEELQILGARPTTGPIIVNELTGRPWTDNQFRRGWRKIANHCGVPKEVRNMDSRAGAISEATDAGADLEHVRQAATHSDIGMTQRYSRNAAEKVVSVQQARAAYRNKTGS